MTRQCFRHQAERLVYVADSINPMYLDEEEMEDMIKDLTKILKAIENEKKR